MGNSIANKFIFLKASLPEHVIKGIEAVTISYKSLQNSHLYHIISEKDID